MVFKCSTYRFIQVNGLNGKIISVFQNEQGYVLQATTPVRPVKIII